MYFKENNGSYQPTASEIERAEDFLDDTSFLNNPIESSGKSKFRDLTEARETAISACKQQMLQEFTSEEMRQQISGEVDPGKFHWVHSFVSEEPLSIIRHALTSKAIDNTQDNGGFVLWTTEEMKSQSERISSVMKDAGFSVTIMNLPSLVEDERRVLDTFGKEFGNMQNDDEKRGERSVFNTTSGSKQLKSVATSMSINHRTPIISISPNSTALKHEFGVANIGNEETVDTQWDRIGIEGLLKLYGKELIRKYGGAEWIGGRWVELVRPKGDVNDFEEEVAEAIVSLPGCEYAAKNIRFHDPTKRPGAEYETDIIAIVNGCLIQIECKDNGPSSFDGDLKREIGSCGSKKLGGRFTRYYFVTKTPPEKLRDMLLPQLSEKVSQTINKAEYTGILLVSFDELIDNIQNIRDIRPKK